MHKKKSQIAGFARLCNFILLVSMIIASSCASVKRITYFNDIPDTISKAPYPIQSTAYTDPKIQPNDILQVSVQTLDPQVASLMGAQGTSTFTTGSTTSATIQGYLVDSAGIVELPLVGKIHVGGMTITQARAAIGAKAELYYKEPVVNVKFGNFTVTVLGEVSRPGQYTLGSERTSVLDAIGLAGDMTMTGRRNDVLVIREENGKKVAVQLNLNSKDVFNSPYFYLKQRDIIDVRPTKSKAIYADAITSRYLSYITTAVTVLTFIFIYITR